MAAELGAPPQANGRQAHHRRRIGARTGAPASFYAPQKKQWRLAWGGGLASARSSSRAPRASRRRLRRWSSTYRAPPRASDLACAAAPPSARASRETRGWPSRLYDASSHPPWCIRRTRVGPLAAPVTRATCPRSHLRCCRTRTRRSPQPARRRRRLSLRSRSSSSFFSSFTTAGGSNLCASTHTSTARPSFPDPSHRRVSRPKVPRRRRQPIGTSADRCSS